MNSKKNNIIITGSDGQLGKSLKYFKHNNLKLVQKKNIKFYFLNKKDFDITNKKNIEKIIKIIQPEYLINTAAYTNVKIAEKKKKLAFSINSEGVKNLAELSDKYKYKIIHISTELVYSGIEKSKKIDEKYLLKPSTIYGKSKLSGEKYLKKYCKNFVILRVSWLYSLNSKNFLNYILSNINNLNFRMIDNALSSPTSCNNLINVIFIIILKKNNLFKKQMIFNICDNGNSVSPFKFTEYILSQLKKLNVNVPKLIKTDFYEYNKDIEKPQYLSLNNSKIKKYISYQPKYWKAEIKNLLKIKYKK